LYETYKVCFSSSSYFIILIIHYHFQYLLDRGINWFDSADSYGTGSLSGRAEELLGTFAERHKGRKSVVATKLAPYPWRIGSQSMIAACRESVQRLQKPVDILQLHWPPVLGWQEKEYLNAFSQLVRNKEATQIGLSNYGPRFVITHISLILVLHFNDML
jgi:pyridoxine 4-dehydrogenase